MFVPYRHTRFGAALFGKFAVLKFSFATLLASAFLLGCSSYQPDYSTIGADGRDATYAHQGEIALPFATEGNTEIADLIRFAQQQHPLVLAAQADVERARAEITAAGAWMDPELSVSQGINDSGWQTLGLSQDIPVFQRRAMAIEQARAGYRAANARLAQVRANLSADVVLAFSEYLYVLENRNIQDDRIALLAQAVAIAEQRYAAGAVAMSDLLRVQNAHDEARSERANIASLLVSQRARLNSALGRDARAELPQHFNLVDTHREYAHLPASADELYATVAKQNPRLLAAKYEIQALQVGQDVANTAGLPRFMVGVEYMNTAMGDGTFTGMASVSLPIWRSSYRALQESAQANMQRGEAQLQAAQLQVQAELSMALYQWREAERNEQLYRDVLIPRAEQAVASLLSQYSNGNASFTDVLSSQQEWISFSLAYQRALANQLSAVATIQSLTAAVAQSEVSQ